MEVVLARHVDKPQRRTGHSKSSVTHLQNKKTHISSGNPMLQNKSVVWAWFCQNDTVSEWVCVCLVKQVDIPFGKCSHVQLISSLTCNWLAKLVCESCNFSGERHMSGTVCLDVCLCSITVSKNLLTDELIQQLKSWGGGAHIQLTSWLIWENEGFWMCSLSVAMRFRAVLSNTTWCTTHMYTPRRVIIRQMKKKKGKKKKKWRKRFPPAQQHGKSQYTAT